MATPIIIMIIPSGREYGRIPANDGIYISKRFGRATIENPTSRRTPPIKAIITPFNIVIIAISWLVLKLQIYIIFFQGICNNSTFDTNTNKKEEKKI